MSALSLSETPAWLQLVILALAAYRLTRLVTTDEVTEPLRERVWSRFPLGKSRVGYLISCDWCVGFWVSLALVACGMISPAPTLVACVVLALSAVVGALSERAARD